MNKNKMYSLIRHCSPFTEADIVLGVFDDEQSAYAARSTYIKKLIRYGDPHHLQHHMYVDLESDVDVEEIQSHVSSTTLQMVYCLYSYVEYLGLVFKHLQYVTDDLDNLRNAHCIKQKDLNYNCEWVYNKIDKNKLYYEYPDEEYLLMTV